MMIGKHERLLAAGIAAFGCALRLLHLTAVGLTSPFGYGGLFAEFAVQIIANRFWLPLIIPFYTDGGIPFAYPPLAFYLEAVVLSLFPKFIFAVATLTPPVLSCIGLALFRRLTHAVSVHPGERLLLLLAYAALPQVFLQHLEAAGLSEALGSLAMIWMMLAYGRHWASRQAGGTLLVGAAWALCLASSPGSAYASLLLWATYALARLSQPPLRIGLSHLLISNSIALLLSSPYWLTVVIHHGASIFISSLAAQHELYRLHTAAAQLLAPEIDVGPYPWLGHGLMYLGAVVSLQRRQWHWLTWYVLFGLIPREGSWLAALPFAVLAGTGGYRAVVWLSGFIRQSTTPSLRGRLIGALAAPLLIMGVVANPISAVQRLVHASRFPFTPEMLAAIDWSGRTPAEAKFLVLADPRFLEWFPHLSRRTVLNVVFGSEWEPAAGAVIRDLQARLAECDTWECIHTQTRALTGYDHLFVYIDASWSKRLLSSANPSGVVMAVLARNSSGALVVLSPP